MTSSLYPPSADCSQLADWLTYLENLHSTEIELGLSRISVVLSRMQLDLSSITLVTVAGTNGKGTTAAFIEALLDCQGQSTALFSSPHIHRYNERLRINRHELDDIEHIQAFQVVEAARQDTSLTYFEFSTLACLYLIARAQPDVAILEVGLGGRLDSINVVDADVAVLTTVALDHQSWLGDTREKIGLEKAGIFRPQRPAVIGELDVPETVISHGEKIGATLLIANQDFGFGYDAQSWSWWSKYARFDAIPLPAIPVQNASTALAVLEQLNRLPSSSQLMQVCNTLSVAGRWQQLAIEPGVILDVAHNPHAATYMVEKIKQLETKGKVRAVFSMMADKDIDEVIAILQPYIDHWYLGQLSMDRAVKVSELRHQLEKHGIEQIQCFDNILSAYKMATQESHKSDNIIVFGSFYTVAAVLENQN